MPGIQEKLAVLFELQMIDSEIIEHMREAKRLDTVQAPVQKEYVRLKAKCDEIENLQTPIKQDIARMKDGAALLSEKRKDIEDKLFSATTNPKELMDFQKKREEIIRQIKSADDEVIKKMIEIDRIEITRKEIVDRLAQIEPEYNKINAERGVRKEELKSKIEVLKKERMRFKSFEDKKLLTKYQQLQRENNGVAIATVADNVCEGCFVEISTATEQRLNYATEIVYCQQCGRILYIPPAKAATASGKA